MINNTVSRTCVLVRSLDGGQHIKDLSSVSVTIRPRNQIPFGLCEPLAETTESWGGCGNPVLGSTPAASTGWLHYPAHDFNEDKTRICFHWDPVLWAQPPGRYMATVYLCCVAIGCFQMQIGKRFTAEDPINVAFNPCEAAVAICSPNVDVGTATPTPDNDHIVCWATPVNSVAGVLSDGSDGSDTASESVVFYGGVLPSITSDNVAYLRTTWAPAAWTSLLSGAQAVEDQLEPITTIQPTGVITVVLRRPARGVLGDVSNGRLEIEAVVDNRVVAGALYITVTNTTVLWGPV